MAEFTIQNIWLICDSHTPESLWQNIERYCEQKGWHFQGVIQFRDLHVASLNTSDLYLLSLADRNLKIFLEEVEEIHVGMLPHPQAPFAKKRFKIADNLEKALQDVDGCETPRIVDNLYCNNQLVLSSVLAGDREAMQPALKIQKHFLARLIFIWHLMLHMIRGRLFEVNFTTGKESQLQTAALGLCVVYNPSDNAFSHRVIANSDIDEPSMHAVVISPRSISEILHFVITRLLPVSKRDMPLNNYLGHIKTQTLDIVFQKPVSIRLDSEEAESEKLQCVVKTTQIGLLHQGLPSSRSTETKESFRVKSLPKGKLVSSLIARPLPWIYHTDPEEVKETFIGLKESAKFTQTYVVLMALSSLLATVGLFANSAPVIIGAMILAPLMAPIISLSMGVLRQEVDLITTSSKTLIFGILLTLFGATLFTWVMPLQSLNSEIGARLSPTLLDLAVAIISGIAGAYASARSEVAKSLAGVAIAVALVPPLVISGIGIGWWDWHVFSGAMLLFITNLFGIVLAAAATFLLLGFSPFHLAKRGLVLSLMVVALVSLPLSWAFYSMVQEQRMVSQLEGVVLVQQQTKVEIRSVHIRRGDPLKINAVLVADHNLQTEDIDRIKNEMQRRLNREIQLEATLSLLR
ncbi:TIGR00341 family protein [Thiomicrorhabdus xiamenensis]|uniref:TIGR00341 family protein n=1 Tax=Thiomicrorhabdus xiamenensis TaxID=2739063 RepID=A0A7D4TE27_9GAMM|nr:TIGR00341 family protein [Thiomicrorhabdus xiamenensis]QKI89107.1 TIGR00341 family protein [Thiomicrorhabdus xiamenensis]